MLLFAFVSIFPLATMLKVSIVAHNLLCYVLATSSPLHSMQSTERACICICSVCESPGLYTNVSCCVLVMPVSDLLYLLFLLSFPPYSVLCILPFDAF